MKVICDTNIFISLFRQIPQALASLKNIGNDNVLMPSITVMELYRGMTTKKDMATMKKKIKHYNILHFNDAVSIQALNLIENFKLSHDLQIPDAIIGAMAIEYQLPLFTYNLKDFSFMPHIQLYKP